MHSHCLEVESIGKHGVVRHASSEAAAHQPNLSDIGLHSASKVCKGDSHRFYQEVSLCYERDEIESSCNNG